MLRVLHLLLRASLLPLLLGLILLANSEQSRSPSGVLLLSGVSLLLSLALLLPVRRRSAPTSQAFPSETRELA